MIWRLMHHLFGWDYIVWHNTVDQGIARVRTDGRGRPFYWQYPMIKVYRVIERRDDVLWLTCRPWKYGL